MMCVFLLAGTGLGGASDDELANAALAGLLRSAAITKSMAAAKKEAIEKKNAVILAKKQEKMIGRF
jgi:hypothetical protein